MSYLWIRESDSSTTVTQISKRLLKGLKCLKPLKPLLLTLNVGPCYYAMLLLLNCIHVAQVFSFSRRNKDGGMEMGGSCGLLSEGVDFSDSSGILCRVPRSSYSWVPPSTFLRGGWTAELPQVAFTRLSVTQRRGMPGSELCWQPGMYAEVQACFLNITPFCFVVWDNACDVFENNAQSQGHCSIAHRV